MTEPKKELVSKVGRGYSATDSTRSLPVPAESTHTLKSANYVKFKDFVPTSAGEKSENFQKLIQRLNQWLKENQEVKINGCETITWLGDGEVKNGENMAHFRNLAEGGITHVTRGLRCWLSPNPHCIPQNIIYFDNTPSTNDRTQHLVDKINKKLRSKHIKGEILAIESVSVPVVKNHLHSGATKWKENADDDVTMAYVIRIFINKTSDQFKLHIGVQDFVPYCSSDGAYENFEHLMQRCNDWFRNQTHIHIINMQSLFVQKEQDPSSELGCQCLYVNPGANNFSPVEILRILRVSYILRPSVEKPVISDSDTPSLESILSYESFIPALVRRKHRDEFEETSKTYERVANYLRNTDLRLINIETVLNPIAMYIRSDEANFQHNPDQVGFIFTFRLFLSTRPRLELKDVLKKWTAIESKMCSPSGEKGEVGHRPLFLRNVVGGQFKYRWLVLAISAFSCMAIIVTVSVVYSNR